MGENYRALMGRMDTIHSIIVDMRYKNITMISADITAKTDIYNKTQLQEDIEEILEWQKNNNTWNNIGNVDYRTNDMLLTYIQVYALAFISIFILIIMIKI